MSPDVNLLIAVPTMGSVHPMLVSRLLRWSREFPHNQVHFYFTAKVSPVDRARNQIVDLFLTKKGNGRPFTHILMIDSDTIPPENAVSRLLSHGKDIVSGLTPIVNFNEQEQAWETYDNCFMGGERDENGKIIKTFIAERNKGLQEIFRCGASCILIKREVFEKLSHPYYAFITNEKNTEHARSEDIRFCDNAREAGFKIYADTDVICGHHKEVMV